jgi:hypothetical protein
MDGGVDASDYNLVYFNNLDSTIFFTCLTIKSNTLYEKNL